MLRKLAVRTPYHALCVQGPREIHETHMTSSFDSNQAINHGNGFTRDVPEDA